MISEPTSGHYAWLDGELVPWSKATLQLCDHHYGVGVFEGVRTFVGRNGRFAFRVADHTQRLLRSARILNIEVPKAFGAETLDAAQLELVRRNDLDSAYLRPFVFYSGIAGLAPRISGLRVRVAIMALPWTERPQAQGASTAVRLRTTSLLRPAALSVFTRAKANANYMLGILAREEACASGADDALLLDQDGYVTETSGANLFVVQRRELVTPPLDSVLEGITRDTVMVLAHSLGLKVNERRLTREDVYVADEAFITGTASDITAVSSLDGRSIGSGGPGEITSRLATLYAELVRGNSDFRRDWLTPI